jgi:hypothetical protein
MGKYKSSILIIVFISIIINSKKTFAINNYSLLNRISFSFSYNGNDKLNLNYTNSKNFIKSNLSKNIEFGLHYSIFKEYKLRYVTGLHYGINATNYTFNVNSRLTNSEILDTYIINDEIYLKLSNEFYKNLFLKNKYGLNLGVGINFKYSPNSISTLNVLTTDNNNNTELLMSNIIEYNHDNKLIKTVSLILEQEYSLKKSKISICNTIDYTFDDHINYTIIFNPTTIERNQYDSSVKNRFTFGVRLNYFL